MFVIDALAKVTSGNLNRSYRRCVKAATSKKDPAGICHLCNAGITDLDFENLFLGFVAVQTTALKLSGFGSLLFLSIFLTKEPKSAIQKNNGPEPAVGHAKSILLQDRHFPYYKLGMRQGFRCFQPVLSFGTLCWKFHRCPADRPDGLLLGVLQRSWDATLLYFSLI